MRPALPACRRRRCSRWATSRTGARTWSPRTPPASKAARRPGGVPAPEVRGVGDSGAGRPYRVADHAAGLEGRLAPDRLGTIEQLGRAARTLHGIRTHGYGKVFDWSINRLSRHASMAEFMNNGLGVDARIAVLVQQRMLGRAQAAALRRTAAEITRWKKP